MWPPAFAAVYRWIYRHVVLAVEFGFAITRKDCQHVLLASDDLSSALIVLQGIFDSAETLHVDEINSVEALIVKTMECIAVSRLFCVFLCSSENKWAVIKYCLCDRAYASIENSGSKSRVPLMRFTRFCLGIAMT